MKNCDPNRVELNRFTKVVFELTQSSFILEATLQAHFDNYLMSYPRAIEKISGDMYVNDLTSEYNTVGEVEILKQKFKDCFQSCFQKKGAFTQVTFLHTINRKH